MLWRVRPATSYSLRKMSPSFLSLNLVPVAGLEPATLAAAASQCSTPTELHRRNY